MEQRRRIAAYGLCRDQAGRVLLARTSTGRSNSGRWILPGGGVEHGEHPAEAVVREVREETGLDVVVRGCVDVLTDVAALPDADAMRHQDRLIYDVQVVGGRLRDERDGTTDKAMWADPLTLHELPLMPFAARVLAVPQPEPARHAAPASAAPASAAPTPVATASSTAVATSAVPAVAVPTVAQAAAEPPAGPAEPAHRVRAKDDPPLRRQRFGAYGLVTDPGGRVLLTLISEGYPGAGGWHLPGGGTDFGESATDGLLRELMEETGQLAEITGIVEVSHRHHRDALGPEGVPIDWHGVRVVFRAVVASPVPVEVRDVGGSTADAAWFTVARALTLPLTEMTRGLLVTLAA